MAGYKIKGTVNKFMEEVEEIKAERNLELAGFDEQSRKGYILLPKYVLDLQIPTTAKLLYCILLDYAWNKDCCNPGQVKLAERMGLKTIQISRLIKELKNCGLISVKITGRSNKYTLHATKR